MIVVADTSPVNYLVLIDEIDLLPQLFGTVVMPEAVWKELQAERSPLVVKNWISTNPSWIDVQQVRRLMKPFNLEPENRRLFRSRTKSTPTWF